MGDESKAKVTLIIEHFLTHYSLLITHYSLNR
jgi:hypothetical protein